jgi:hypothetical protein
MGSGILLRVLSNFSKRLLISSIDLFIPTTDEDSSEKKLINPISSRLSEKSDISQRDFAFHSSFSAIFDRFANLTRLL